MADAATSPHSAPSPKAMLLALAALLLCLQGARGLWEPDEGRYSATAWQMLERGDWFTPHLASDLPHFTKPPLTYWVLAASMRLLGANEWALRLPVGAAGILTVLLVYAMARRLAPADPLLAATVQATSLLPFVAVHLITTDPFLMLFETLAVAGFVAAWWDNPPPRWALPAMWAGFGLAFLTKGPPGLLPLLPILVFAAWSRGGRSLLRLFSPAGLALFAAIALPWFLLQLRARPDLLGYFLGSEVEGRVLGAHVRNPGWRGLFKVNVAVLVAAWLPWSVVALVRRRPWRGRAERAAGSETAAPVATAPVAGTDAAATASQGNVAASAVAAGTTAGRRDALARRFLWLWLLLPVVVFSVSQSRQPLYLLPLTVPGSLLLARALAPSWRWSRRERGWVAAWALALLALTAVAAAADHPRDGRGFAASLAALLDERPQALIFVDKPGRYGVTLYCHCDVEAVQLLQDLVARAGPAYRPLARPLADELARRRRGTVWLVPGPSLAAWQRALADAGWQARRLGRVERFEVFAASPPETP